MLWKKNDNDYESSAKVVDGNLILSLPDAINPIVWRMELGSVKASALEVKSADGTFTLFLKTPKGDVHDIAPFENRDLAVRALMRVSAAMQNAQGKMAPVTQTPAPAAPIAFPVQMKGDGSAIKWLLTLGGILLVIFLFAYLSSMRPSSLDSGGTGMATSDDSESGVPQSADDVLRGNL